MTSPPAAASRAPAPELAVRTHRYHRVDVFTDRPFGGNPLAVFPDAATLSAAEMQAVAREMNLSETVFVGAPAAADALLRLRIFTVDRELPLAGHPVVGTIHVLATTGALEIGRGSTIVPCELGAGVMPVEVLTEYDEDGQLVVHSVVMTQRRPAFGAPLDETELIADALGLRGEDVGIAELPARVVDTGVPWFLVPLRDLPSLRRVQPNFAACRAIAERVGTDLIYAFTQDVDDPRCTAHGRHVWYGTVTPGEDPVTGSAAACLASYLVAEGVLLAAPSAEVLIEQGHEVGRPGHVTALVDVDGGSVSRVRVGGTAVHVGDGELRF